MCRRVFIHHMHHDVRTPLILDNLSQDPRVYANPLRTCHHHCEVDLERIRRDLGLQPAGEQPPCEYHACCLVREEVRRCLQHPGAAVTAAAHDDGGDDECGEPEECEAFVLEHRHVPLRTWDVVAGWAAAAGLPEPGVLPAAAWAPYGELVWDHDWRPVYRGERRLYPRWQEAAFAWGEELHRRRADRAVHEAVLLDLTRDPRAATSWEARVGAVDSYFAAARALCLLELRIHEHFSLAAAPAAAERVSEGLSGVPE